MLRNLMRLARIPDWRLTTAEILYRLPDHPGVLQAFIWQKLDRPPTFPELNRFLDFWRREIEGPLHSVRVASSALIRRNCATLMGNSFCISRPVLGCTAQGLGLQLKGSPSAMAIKT